MWTGRELVVWGGAGGYGTFRGGATYNPATGDWRSIAAAPVPAQAVGGAVWTGREMLVLTLSGELLGYDPAGNRWRTLADLPLRARHRSAIVWTGALLVVWGGCDAIVAQCDDMPLRDEFADGAAYDPATNAWHTLAPSPLVARDRPHAVWTGREVVIWGGDTPGDRTDAYGGRTTRWPTAGGRSPTRRSDGVPTTRWCGPAPGCWSGAA